jgi:hypothetical protein
LQGASIFADGKLMRIPGGSLEPEARNPCPICGAETTLAECEPHPLYVHFKIHGYLCDRCGPIKSLVVKAYPEARQTRMASTKLRNRAQ